MEGMMATVALDPKRYGKLLSHVQPHPIHSEDEYDRVVGQIGKLMEKSEEELSHEESSLLEMLSILVEKYDEEHYQPKGSSPAETIGFLMEQREVKPKDLWSLLGSKGRVSEILSSIRTPSKEQAKKLAKFFHVPADLFL
jgi:HTH-type transcriptional regulator / antitoxin HigA